MLPTAVRVVSLVGCLRRLVMVVIVLILLAVLAFYALFGVGGFLVSSTEGAVPSHAAAGIRGAATVRHRTGSNSGALIPGMGPTPSAVAVGRMARAAHRDVGDVWLVHRRARHAATRRL